MNLEEAKKLSRTILETLSPYCDRIEVAGSIRRNKRYGVKDIEIVAIPQNKRLFELAHHVNRTWGEPTIGAFPSHYTRIRGAVNIDFFWCNKPEKWGLLFFIRTGPADYVQRALTQWKEQTGGGYSRECVLYDRHKIPHYTPQEEDVFTALGWKWQEPERRL